KQGDGILTLAAANTFDGTVNVNQGAISVTNSAGLGLTTGGTFVNSGGEVLLSGGVTVAENFVIRDVGGADPTTGNGLFDASKLGAIRNISGSNTLTGVITLGNNSGFGVESGTNLTIGSGAAGQVMMVPSATLSGDTG